ncbi:MAG: sugar kinase [Candidatus Cloacimonetes bacterium]|nr:sugar kinase [Candidatus Cloacimonadota bacterium]MBS3767240.1 sugar kinase [Candidatus Cloacimonadota bacterium]
MSLLICGSIALDTVENEHGKVAEALGGSATYTSIAASYLCDHIAIVGVVGEDFPQEYIELLEKRNVDVTGVETAKGKTFRWCARYDDLSEAITLDTQLNVFEEFSPKIPKKFEGAEYIYLGNIDPSLQKEVLQKMNNTALIGADTMNLWIETKNKELKELLPQIDVLFINNDELKMLTEEKNLLKAANIAVEMGPKFVVVKQGEFGAFIYSKNMLFFTPIFPTTIVKDTTGAGDCFAGGFMGYLSSVGKTDEKSMKKALIYGTILSSYNIEDFSIKKVCKISKEDIQKRYEKLKIFTQF